MSRPEFSLETGVWAGMVGLLGAGLQIVAPAWHIVGWVLIASAVGLFLWGIRIDGDALWKCERRKVMLIWPLIVILLSTIGLGVGIWGYVRGRPETDAGTSRKSAIGNTTEAQFASAEGEPPRTPAPVSATPARSPEQPARAVPSIDLKCNQSRLPDFVPASGGYRSIFMFNRADDIQFDMSTVSFPLPPGTKLPQAENVVEIAVLCTVTNYGQDPLFAVRIPAEVALRPAVPSDGRTDGLTLVQNGARSGPITLVKRKELFIDRLDVGPDQSFTVFLQCPPPNFVQVTFEGPVTGTQLGASRATRLHLVEAATPLQHIALVAPPIRPGT